MVGGGPDVDTIDGGGTRVRGSVAAVALPLVVRSSPFRNTREERTPPRAYNNGGCLNATEQVLPGEYCLVCVCAVRSAPRLAIITTELV